MPIPARLRSYMLAELHMILMSGVYANEGAVREYALYVDYYKERYLVHKKTNNSGEAQLKALADMYDLFCAEKLGV